jgi:TonB family protein
LRVELEADEAMKQPVDHVSPEYPAEAKAAHIQGIVSLLVIIGKDGKVTDVKEISGPPELIDAAVAAAKQ